MTARTFANALTIAREAVFASARLNGRGRDINDVDRATGIKWMSNLLWEVQASEGGFLGLSDAQFEAFCDENRQTVSRALAEKALWAREIRWPPDAEAEAERARWHEATARNLAFRATHPDPAQTSPCASPERAARSPQKPSPSRLSRHDARAAKALAANIDRALAPGAAQEEAA